MAAKNQKDKTSTAFSSTDSYSLVVSVVKTHKDLNTNLDALLAQAEKSGRINEVIINTSERNQKILSESKEINRYFENDFAKYYISPKSDLAGAGNLCTEDEIIICDTDIKINLTETLQSIQTKKKASKANVYIECDSIGKKGFFSGKIIQFIFNFVVRLFTPVSFKNINANVSVIKKKNAELLLLNTTNGITRNLSIAYKSALLNIPTTSFTVSGNKYSVGLSGYLIGIIKTVWAAIYHRVDWFIKSPLNELRRKKELNTIDNKYDLIKNGNHPLYRLLFGLLVTISLFFLPIISKDYNLTWDEPLHSEYAVDMVNYYKTFGGDTSVFNINKRAYGTMLYYGSSFDFFAEIIHSTFPVFGIYETRHILNSLVGLIGFIFAALLARRIAGWRTGLLCFIFLVFSPSYFGQIMNNPKDIPFASSFIMGIYFIFLLFKELPKPSFKNIAGSIIAIAWSISIRPGGMILIGILGVFLGIDWLIRSKEEKLKNTLKLVWPYAKTLIIIGVLGYFMGLIFWPYGIKNPIKNPFIALEKMTNFSFLTIYELFDGIKYFDNKPWYYLPKYLLITAPLFVIAGFTLGFSVLFNKSSKIKPVYLFLILFAIVFPPAYAIYKDSLLYNGWRHFLFIYPPIVVVAGIGWNNILSISKNKIVFASIAVIMLASVVNTKIWMLKNHPLEYLYYNEIVGGVKGAYGNYETDYWCQSTRPAIEWLIENKPEIKNKKTIVSTNNEFHSVLYHAQKASDSIRVTWSREMEWNKQYWDYAIWTSRTLSREQLLNGAFPPKGTIYTVDVEGVPIAAVVERKNTYMPDGYKFFEMNNFKEAAASFKKATEYDPNDEEGFRALGWAQFYLNEYDNCIKSFERSIEIRPDNFFSYGFISAAYMRKGDNEKALKNAEASIKYKVNNTMAYEIMADIYYNTQKFDLAIKNYELVGKHGGESAQLYNKIGKCYVGKYSIDPSLGKSNLENALSYFEVAIKIDPNFAEPYYTIGMILNQQGKKAEGDKYIQKAKSLMGNK